jgi:hypothetical protein
MGWWNRLTTTDVRAPRSIGCDHSEAAGIPDKRVIIMFVLRLLFRDYVLCRRLRSLPQPPGCVNVARAGSYADRQRQSGARQLAAVLGAAGNCVTPKTGLISTANRFIGRARLNT